MPFFKYVVLFPELAPYLAWFLDRIGYFKRWNEIDLEPGYAVLKLVQEKHQITDEQLQDTLKDIESGRLDESTKLYDDKRLVDPGVVIRLLSAGTVAGKKLTKDQIAANLAVLMVAGHETTSVALSFIIHELAKDKDKENKLMQEIDQIKDLNQLDISDLDNLRYINATIKEGLRIYTPNPSIYRMNNGKAIKVKEYVIPEGSFCQLATRAIHLDEKYYPRALEFLPERWMGDSKLAPYNEHAYFPFGFGARQCPAVRLAFIEL